MKPHVERANSWLEKNFGTKGLHLLIWLIPATIMTLLSGILSGNAITIMLSLLAAGGTGLLLYRVYRSSRDDQRVDKKGFIIAKKSASYFGLIQFILSSVNLILAWSNEAIELPVYYALYAMVVLSYGLYIPLYRSVNHKENLKRLGLITFEKKGSRRKAVPVKVFRGFAAEVLSWVDAILWTIVFVIFINSLIFQLYQIPTESMVPEHYVGSRVLAVKTLYNPRIPLSLVDIPVTLGVNRFDQLVLDNPRHTLPRNQALKEFFDNALFMITFSAVQRPKIDINGDIVVEPLIKRLIGMPGEQIMMVDDVVYVRDSTDGEFRILEGDDSHALNFVTNLPVNTRRIERITVSPLVREEMLRWDREKEELTGSYPGRANDITEELIALAEELSVPGDLPAVRSTPDFRFRGWFEISEDMLAEYAVFALTDTRVFAEDFRDFMLAGTGNRGSRNASAFEISARRTNRLFKLKFARALLDMVDSMGNGGTSFAPSLAELNDYTGTYVQTYFDMRNFAPFPENEVLSRREYFFMGDNRYGSLDSRHWDEGGFRERALDSADPYSLRYASRIDPFAFDARDIRGKSFLGVF